MGKWPWALPSSESEGAGSLGVGKADKRAEIRSGKGARYKDFGFGWKDRALYLGEPRAKRGGKTVVSSKLRAVSPACPLPTQAALTHSFLPPLHFCVYVRACVLCAVCSAEVRGQPVEWEWSSPFTM